MVNVAQCENDLSIESPPHLYKPKRNYNLVLNNEIKSLSSTKITHNKEIKDFINFLTKTKGCDMLPYAFMSTKDFYTPLISKSNTYYLFQDEVAIIKKAKDYLPKYFKDVSRFIT